MLNCDYKTADGALSVMLEGVLDALTARDFETALVPRLADAKSVTFDFEKLQFISSAGLRVLLLAEQTMEKKGEKKMKIVHMSSMIRELFEITGFADLLTIE